MKKSSEQWFDCFPNYEEPAERTVDSANKALSGLHIAAFPAVLSIYANMLSVCH